MKPTTCDVNAALQSENHYGYVESDNNGLVVLIGTGKENLTLTPSFVDGKPFGPDMEFHVFTRDETIATLEKFAPLDPELEKVIVGGVQGTFPGPDTVLFVQDTAANKFAVIYVKANFKFGS